MLLFATHLVANSLLCHQIQKLVDTWSKYGYGLPRKKFPRGSKDYSPSFATFLSSYVSTFMQRSHLMSTCVSTKITTRLCSSYRHRNDVTNFVFSIEGENDVPISLCSRAPLIKDLLWRQLLIHTVVLTVLQALAVADTLVLVSTLLTQSLRQIGWAAYNNVYGHIFIIFYPITYCVRLVDTWLTVLLTVDRYVAVWQPLKIITRSGTSRTWMIISAMTIASVLFSLPRCFEYRLVDNDNHKFVPTSLTHDRVYMIFYRTSLFFVLTYLFLLSLPEDQKMGLRQLLGG